MKPLSLSFTRLGWVLIYRLNFVRHFESYFLRKAIRIVKKNKLKKKINAHAFEMWNLIMYYLPPLWLYPESRNQSYDGTSYNLCHGQNLYQYHSKCIFNAHISICARLVLNGLSLGFGLSLVTARWGEIPCFHARSLNSARQLLIHVGCSERGLKSLISKHLL